MADPTGPPSASPRNAPHAVQDPQTDAMAQDVLPTEKELVEERAESPISDDGKGKTLADLSRTRSAQSTWTTTSAGSDIAHDESPERRTWTQRLNPLKRKYIPPVPKERTVSREYNAGWFSRLTFQWMADLMSVGYQRPLELNDIWTVNPHRSVDVLADRLYAALARRRASGKPNALRWAIYDTFKREFWIGGITQVFAAAIQVLSPFTLKFLILFAGQAYQHAQGLGPAPDLGHGIGLVFAILIMQIVQSFCTSHFIYNGMILGGQARSVLIAVIFDKAMRLSGRAKAGGDSTQSAAADDERLPAGTKPGSKEEKSWLKRKLARKTSKKDGSGEPTAFGNGKIINMMSTDTYRIDQGSGMFHIAWTSPLQVILALALLLINLTYSALAGFAFICIMIPLLGRAIGSLMRRRKYINTVTDERVSLTQEILSSVRFVKYFGWETSFLDRLAKIRKIEINKIAFLLSIRNAILSVSMAVPNFASMLAFITYSLTQHALNPAPIFSSLALFNSLRIPLNLLPQVIGQIVDANDSINRIEKFLDAEEVSDEAAWEPESKDAIVLENATFTWERSSPPEAEIDGKSSKQIKKERKADLEKRKRNETVKEKEAGPKSPDSSSGSSFGDEKPVEEAKPFSIQDINLSVARNELIAVIGTVGSGKSSLLGALAGDMRRVAGQYKMGASRAFCPQYAWIQNATVKQNITFGRPFKQEWYDAVIDACALRPDLDMLPAGDLTEIGEKGINLSGGQKQRLNIARAIYFDADFVLMDDPLSAVDAHVGRHIMDQAICGLLQNKCRVLATHQLHVLHRVDRIVWMKEGRIHKTATFPDLMENDPEFRKLMETTAVEEKEVAKEGEDEEEEVTAEDVENEKKIARKRQKANKKGAALMQQEERSVSSVSFEVYLAYIRASGSIFNALWVFFLLVASQAANIATSLWLSFWTSNRFGYSVGVYIGLYAALGVAQALLMFAFSTILTIMGTTASKTLLHRAMERVLRAPMSFFDTTPLGRITNRFSKDVDTLDNSLVDAMRMFFLTMGMIISVFILIIAYYYYFAVALVPLTITFLLSANYYRASAREIKRHEAVLRSHVFSRFSEAVSGTTTLRAYGVTDEFAKSVRSAIDDMDSAYFLTFGNQRWLSVRLDAIGNLLVFVVGILVVTSRFSVNPSAGGLVLSYIVSIVMMLQFTVRQLAEVENHMNSTERIHYYGTQLEEEAPLRLGDVRESWPEKGEIVFENVQMRYRAGLPLVLKGLNMHVKAGERIGVVGRTGAGKSTIMSTLFRLVELSGGSITVDGVNIAKIGLHDLRSRLAIIPQDPTLFKGTIRSNLDPFNERTDLELWNALRQADLVGEHQNIGDETGRIHLDTQVEDEGLNFSLGQRQLLALARALVRGSQIIVCDEATSSVDFETDLKIQKTIVRGFKGKTLLCIAHRLKTIIGYDRILVMDAGNVAELDSPLRLFDQGGIFRSMCDRSGIRREDFFNSDEAHFNDESPALERLESKALGLRKDME